MQTQAIYDTLTPIFREVLDHDDLILRADMVAGEVDGWDSLAHIRLIVSIEEAFRVRFNASEVAALRNVGDMVALITAKQAAHA